MEDISLGLLLRGGWMLPLSICHADMPADLFSGTKQCQFRILLVPPLKLCAWQRTFLTGEKSEDHYFFAEGLLSSAMAAWEPKYSIFFSGTVGCSTGKTASENNSCCCANFL